MASAALAAKGSYRPGFLAAIDACLKVRHTERPQSVAQLRPMLLGAGQKSASTAKVAARPAVFSGCHLRGHPTGLTNWWVAIASVALLVTGIVFAAYALD